MQLDKIIGDIQEVTPVTKAAGTEPRMFKFAGGKGFLAVRPGFEKYAAEMLVLFANHSVEPTMKSRGHNAFADALDRIVTN
jgi:hypothetical protein